MCMHSVLTNFIHLLGSLLHLFADDGTIVAKSRDDSEPPLVITWTDLNM